MRARLQKILAAAGLASRREAESLLRANRVTVNGQVASLGDSADPDRDVVALDGEPVRAARKAYWLLHKPRGVISTRSDPDGRPKVIDLLPPRASNLRLNPVGRLDVESEGLLLLTNDGEAAHVLLHPSLGSEKEYLVTARGKVRDATARRLARGVRLEDGVTAPAKVVVGPYDARGDTTKLTLTLREGRKRQIRRALESLGHPVSRLLRVRMGPLRLGRLAPGESRQLNEAELATLHAHVAARGAPDDSHAAHAEAHAEAGAKPRRSARKGSGRLRGTRPSS